MLGSQKNREEGTEISHEPLAPPPASLMSTRVGMSGAMDEPATARHYHLSWGSTLSAVCWVGLDKWTCILHMVLVLKNLWLCLPAYQLLATTDFFFF